MKSVMSHSFSRAPTIDAPRSSFDRSSGYKTTFDFDYLIPFFLDEALPGDTFNLSCGCFARLATPIHPIMDNMFVDVFFFSVPVRQLWVDQFATNTRGWRAFMGERQDHDDDNTDMLVPVMDFSGDSVDVHDLADYFGLPLGYNEDGTNNNPVSALPFRAYQHIYTEWFRDQNLIDSWNFPVDAGPDAITNYPLLKRGKRHDYFTACLPWPQKSDNPVLLPLGVSAPGAVTATTPSGNVQAQNWYDADDHTLLGSSIIDAGNTAGPSISGFPHATGPIYLGFDPETQLEVLVDLTSATAATVNQVREAIKVQELLEVDARGGTRYPEIIRAHFGVEFFDVTYRPEYLGGASVPINIHPVPQTSETGTTAQGNLAAFGTVGLSSGGFTKSFTEHCIVMGIACARADLTYQQGINRMWLRRTRYDFYWPALANLGEQAVLSREIYWDGSGDDLDVFGYIPRYDEYRYKPSMITGLFRSNAAGTLDSWHLSEDFATRPVLGQDFIEQNTPVDRVIEVATEPHLIADFYINLNCARPMPMYAVPGFMSRF